MSIELDASFPGGNIVLERIEGNDVYVHQDLWDTDRPWFYWCFDVTGAAGQELTFRFTQSRALGTRGPAVSADSGRTWRWVGIESVADNSFRYAFGPDDRRLRFSFAMPYQLEHWNIFTASLPQTPLFSVHELCTTNKGRTAPYALLGSSAPRQRVVVTARHHCCEMMASYCIEGLIQWVLNSPEPAAARVRESVQFLIVPFADLDGVEQGDQGKGRMPRDHGRDYAGKSLYAETRAVRELVPDWSAGMLKLALDLHCPWIAGKNNQWVYLVGCEDPAQAAEQQRFGRMLEDTATGPLPFNAGDYLPFGTDWNTGMNYGEGKNGAAWFRELPGIRLGTTIEIPYATARGAEVTAETAALFGADLGRAVAAYLLS